GAHRWFRLVERKVWARDMDRFTFSL
ncbi:MAG: hypothetical protein JWO66_1180, partial [Candidatus Eremiobacteraeota bacterium]|nr:hypothetical protein [Candidatus Eremiobacteraeota bacterium]